MEDVLVSAHSGGLVTIHEPMTAATDLIMAAVLLVLFVPLYRHGHVSGQKSVSLWSAAFFFVAMAAIVAGITHGVGPNLDPAFMQTIWKLSADLVGLGSFFMLIGTILAVVPRPLSYWLSALAVPKYILYIMYVATHKLTLDDYRIVIYDYGSALVIVLALMVYAALVRRERAAPWLIVAVAISFVGALVQQGGWVVHRHFNHNDMYHIISLISFYAFYRGARLLRDR